VTTTRSARATPERSGTTASSPSPRRDRDARGAGDEPLRPGRDGRAGDLLRTVDAVDDDGDRTAHGDADAASSATARANGGIADSDVPKAPVSASSTAPMPPSPIRRQTASAVCALTVAASAATAGPSAAIHQAASPCAGR
jgi:hypothetical protein